MFTIKPWNADFKHSDTAFYDYEDRKWYMVFDPNPSKGKEVRMFSLYF